MDLLCSWDTGEQEPCQVHTETLQYEGTHIGTSARNMAARKSNAQQQSVNQGKSVQQAAQEEL